VAGDPGDDARPPTELADDRSTSTLAALRHGEFRLLFAGLLPAGIGFWMQEFAVGWIVVQLAVTEGNPALGGFYLGLKSLASAVPSLFVGLFAGVFADRTDRRRLLLATRVGSAIAALILGILVLTDHWNILVVMLLSALSSAAYAFDPPGRQAILPKLVPGRDLFSAMGLVRASQQVSQTTGPLVAGLLMVPIGAGGVILSKAVLMLASMTMLLPLRPQPVEPGAREVSVLRSLREGLAYMLVDDLIRWCVILQILFAVLGMSFVQLLPAVAIETLKVGSTELSWLAAGVGAGTLVGAFIIASLGNVERRGALLLGLMLAFGIVLAFFGVQRTVLGAVVGAAALGVLMQLFIGGLAVTLQIATPDRLRGRILGTQSVIFQGFGPVGVLAIGTAGSVIGITTAILITGVTVAVLAVLVFWRVPIIRNLRRSTDRPLAGPEPDALG
jgi:MFS family permease